jgi:hypothetical protein
MFKDRPKIATLLGCARYNSSQVFVGCASLKMDAVRPLEWSEPALPETRIFSISAVRTSNLTAEDIE